MASRLVERYGRPAWVFTSHRALMQSSERSLPQNSLQQIFSVIFSVMEAMGQGQLFLNDLAGTLWQRGLLFIVSSDSSYKSSSYGLRAILK